MKNFKRILAIALIVMMVVPMMTTGLSAATAENTYVYSNAGTEVAGGNWKAFVSCDFSGSYGADFALYDYNGLVTVDSEGQMCLYNTIQKDFAGTPFVTPAGRNVLQSTNTTAIDDLFMQFGFLPSGNNGAYPVNFSLAFSETQLQGSLTADSYTVENGFAVEDNGMVKDGLVINMYRTSVPANADPSYEVITAYVMENGKVISSQSFDIDYQGKDFGLTVGHPMRTFFTFDDAGVFTYHVEDTYSADGAYINQTYTFDELDMSTINASEKKYYFAAGTGDYWDANTSAGLNINLARIGTVIDDGDGTYSVEGETKNLADWTGFGVASCEHVWGEYVEVTAATCTTAGILEAACQNGCGATDVKNVAATGHDWSDWANTVEPTCTDEGVRARSCANCGEVQSDPAAALGHAWGDWYETVAPDCENEGSEQRDCATCGSYEENVLAALGHEWVWDTLATATNNGARHCDVCDTVEEDLAYDVSYYWTIASNNKVGTVDADFAEYNDEYGVVADYSVTLQDLSYVYNGPYNYNVMLKATSEFKTSLAGFSVTVDTLEDNYIGSNLENEYPTVLSYMWTNQKENYDGANEFSTYTTGLGATAEASRYGHIWNNYLADEYSLNVVLSDGALFWGSTWYGELDDGEYDWLYYTVVSEGNYWTTKMVQLNPVVSAYEPITLSMFTEYNPDAEKVGVFCDINGQLIELSEAAGSQLNGQDYYFSVASYADGANASTASFVIEDICYGSAAEFAGYAHECSYYYETEPTCTEDGIVMCYECTKLVSTTPATGHNFVDFVCTNCGELEGSVAIGDVAYATLEDALAAANDGDTIKLLEGINKATTYTFNKNVNLDLNGKTLRHPGGNTMVVDGATVTLVGTSGTIRSSDGISVTVVNGGSFVMDVPATVRCSSEEGFGVFSIDDTSSVVINALGGRFYKDPTAVGATLADGLAISGEGTNWTVIEAPVEEPTKDYVITFDPDGGVMPEGALLELPINYNENYKEAAGYDYPVPTLEVGYVFTGWYWEAYNYTLYKGDWDTGYYAVQDSITLVALYEECAHTNFSDWTVTVEPQVGVAGEQAKTCLDCGFVVTEEIPALDSPAKDYVMRFFLEEADVEIGAKIDGTDATELLIPINANEDYNDAYGDFPTASLEGYIFQGWFLQAYGFMMTEGEWNGGSYAVPGDCELYAIFEECGHVNFSDWNVTVAPTYTAEGVQERTCLDCGYVETGVVPMLTKDYTITFDPDGGVMPEGVELAYGINYNENYKDATGVDYPVPTMDGYVFAGWYWELYSYVLDEGTWAGGYFAVQMDVTFVALWEEAPAPAKDYTIFFDADGGVLPEGFAAEQGINAREDYNDAIGEYPVPTMEGYVFVGWYLAAYGFNMTKEEWDNGVYGLTSDCTLIALWEEAPAPVEVEVAVDNNVITVTNIDASVKDVWVAAGACDTYAAVKDGKLYMIPGNSYKVVDGTWSYKVAENGVYTVMIRYNDGTVESKYFVVECDDYVVPGVAVKAVDNVITVSGLDATTKDVWVAAGELDNYADVKANMLYRVKGDSPKKIVDGTWSYKVADGTYTVLVRNNDGVESYTVVTVGTPAPVYPERAYTITFDPDGGVMPAGTVTVLPIDNGQNYKEAAGYDYPVPTLEGYNFAGWYWEEYNFTLTEGDWNGGNYAITWSIDVVALWEEA